jgi:carbamoyl-phosphate synthase large subunit
MSEWEEFYIVGTDSGKYNVFRSEADKTYLCPRADHDEYIPFLKHIIKKEEIQFLHSQPEIEIYTIGKHREEILNTGCLLFMPPQETIEKLRDKWTSYTIWRDAGLKVPQSVIINTTMDLMFAFEKFGREIWIRETVGAAGKGSLSRPSYQTALRWLGSHDGG